MDVVTQETAIGCKRAEEVFRVLCRARRHVYLMKLRQSSSDRFLEALTVRPGVRGWNAKPIPIGAQEHSSSRGAHCVPGSIVTRIRIRDERNILR